MKRLLIVGIVALLALPSVASAGLFSVFDTGGEYINKLKYTNFEIFLRPASESDTGAFQIGSGWYTDVSLADVQGTVVNGEGQVTQEGDFLVQILDAKQLLVVDANDEEVRTVDMVKHPGEITAYAVSQIGTEIANRVYYLKQASSDPFGKLSPASGQMAAIYLDEDPDYGFSCSGGGCSTTGAKLENDVGTATDGEMAATFGFGDAIDNLATDDASATIDIAYNYMSAMVFGGLNVLEVGDPWPPAVEFPGVFNACDETCSTINSIRIESKTLVNIRYPDNSPWRYKSEDPWEFRLTPEPNSLMALLGILGMFLVGDVFQHFRKT